MCSSGYDLNTRRTSHLIVMLDPQAKLGQKNVSLCHSIQKTIYENLLEKQFGQSGGYLVFVLTCRDIDTVDRLRSVMIMGIRTAWLATNIQPTAEVGPPPPMPPLSMSSMHEHNNFRYL